MAGEGFFLILNLYFIPAFLCIIVNSYLHFLLTCCGDCVAVCGGFEENIKNPGDGLAILQVKAQSCSPPQQWCQS